MGRTLHKNAGKNYGVSMINNIIIFIRINLSTKTHINLKYKER